jgi:hypothetical protein
MKTDFLLVTPEMCAEWLKTNTGNRPVRKHVVKRYSWAMIDGRWGRHHQGYLIGKNGEILDGQHRMMAQVASGVSLMVLVSTMEDGDEDASILSLRVDEGIARSVADKSLLSSRMVAVCGAMYRVVTSSQIKVSKWDPEDFVSVSRVIVDTMSINNTARKGMTSTVQAVFVCAAYKLSDPLIEEQWQLHVDSVERHGKWPSVSRVIKSTTESSMLGRSHGDVKDTSARFIALWWLALQPANRQRGSLPGNASVIEAAREEVRGVAREILEKAGVMI